MPFNVPASTHSPGDANFTGDINAEYAATAALASGNVLNTVYAGGADPSGVADSTAAIGAALSAAGVAILPPGTYKVGNLVVPANNVLTGYGATIVPGATGVTIACGSGARIGPFTAYGGSTTTSSNPAADFFVPSAGATGWSVIDVNASYLNGYYLNPTITGSTHGQVRGADVTDCAGGILLSQGTGNTTITAEIMLAAVNIQRCKTNPALSVMGVTDLIGSGLNFSVDGSTNTGPTTLIQGKCGGSLSGIDWGVVGSATAGVGVLTVQDAGGGSPSNWNITGGQVQGGGIGVVISGAAARLRITGIMASGNLGDGWQLAGTGTAIALIGCSGNTNNSAAGTAYDAEVTSTAHVLLDGFAYCSSAVTNSLIVPGTNHVTNVSPTSPGGKSVSGTPSGW